MLCAVLPVNKPRGCSSFDVIRDLKRILPPALKKEKIGHGGTLDTMAEGVLPVLLGEATKAFDFLLKSDKIYRALVQLGATTNTDDAEGEITERSGVTATEESVRSVLPRFTGVIDQVPPQFSALRVNGVRSYELARKNRGVEHKPRPVTVHSLEMTDFRADAQEFTLTVVCSSGTYIRSLARDIGRAVGTGAHLTALLRLKSAGITLDNCRTPDELRETGVENALLDLNDVLDLPALEWTGVPDHIQNGRLLDTGMFRDPPSADGTYKLVDHNRVLAVVEKTGGNFSYLRVFRA